MHLLISSYGDHRLLLGTVHSFVEKILQASCGALPRV